jgi:hypothetical protein
MDKEQPDRRKYFEMVSNLKTKGSAPIPRETFKSRAVAESFGLSKGNAAIAARILKIN